MKKLLAPLLLAFFLSEPIAQACNFVPKSFDENFKEAPIVFIGYVKHARGKRVTFTIEKAIKGIGRRKNYTILRGFSSCHFDFKPGSLWLYLGPQLQQGSMRLTDNYGRPIEPAAALLKEKLGIDLYDTNPTVFPAIAMNACGPTDGPAFYVRLKNGLTVRVDDTSLAKYEGSSEAVVFKSDARRLSAVIYSCDAQGKNCGPRLNGSITLTAVTTQAAKGYVDVRNADIGLNERFIFEAERLPDQTLCP